MKKLASWSPALIRATLQFVIVAVLATLPLSTVTAAPNSQREQAFQSAAAEFGVPAEVLKAISYNQSRWENHKGQPSVSGGYGLMHLTTKIEPRDGRGDPKRPLEPRQAAAREYTLDKAAQLLGTTPKELQTNDTQNVRGGAAVLAQYAKENNGGQLPATLEGWYAAVAKISDASDSEAAQTFADDVYKTIKSGANRTTLDGQSLSIGARSVEPNRAEVEKLNLPKPQHHSDSKAECPPTLTCKFVPARFAQNDPNNPYDYGNYDLANREKDFDIKYIIIHDTEGSYQSAIDWYRDPRSYVSAQYTIRSSDGEVTQSVKNDDIAWQAGNWYMNTHSIGIEHEGFAAEGAAWYTEAMYRSSAKLVRYLAEKYDIPLDREHIVGHDQYHGINPDRVPAMHWDPGPYWDWEHYMNLLHQPTRPTDGPDSKAVTIAPKFQHNKPPVTQCEDDTCTPLPEQPANFVYIRTKPEHDAPLVGDAGLHPGGEPSTTRVEDWGAKATHGQRFAVAERKGDWTAIWFGGQKGWFYNPRFGNKTALPAKARFITPKSGQESVPIYGRPLPEESAYPDIPNIPKEPISPLQYSIPAGQKYVAYDRESINDYLLIWTFDFSGPGDGTIIYGNEKYIPIVYNHRQAFVKASDVSWTH